MSDAARKLLNKSLDALLLHARTFVETIDAAEPGHIDLEDLRSLVDLLDTSAETAALAYEAWEESLALGTESASPAPPRPTTPPAPRTPETRRPVPMLPQVPGRVAPPPVPQDGHGSSLFDGGPVVG